MIKTISKVIDTIIGRQLITMMMIMNVAKSGMCALHFLIFLKPAVIIHVLKNHK